MFVIYDIPCIVQIITEKIHILVSYTVCLTTFTAPCVVHTMETVRIFQRLLLTMIVMMIILIEFTVEFQIILELKFSDYIAGKVVFKFTLLFPFTTCIFLIL